MIDEKNEAAHMHEHHHEHHDHCGCGHEHHHEHHNHQHVYTQAEVQQMMQKQMFNDLQSGMKKVQALHDKIDNVMLKVDKENVGLVLTQKKTLDELKSLAQEVFKDANRVPLVHTLYDAEKDYIHDMEKLMRAAQKLKNDERK